MMMFDAMTTWSAIGEYRNTESTVYRMDFRPVGYLTSVQNLRQLVVRNAGHMVPKDQPEVALKMFTEFLAGTL